MVETAAAIDAVWKQAYEAAQVEVRRLQQRVAALEAELSQAKSLLKIHTNQWYQHG